MLDINAVSDDIYLLHRLLNSRSGTVPGNRIVAAYIGLGSNLGDRLSNLQGAIDRLDRAEGIAVTAVSHVYETAPIGSPEQSDYLNAAIAIETDREAGEVMDICLTVEKTMGRTRTVRWGPREIDIDILLYGTLCIESERLTIPHPRMHERAFVLIPLADIDGYIEHPVLKKTVFALLEGIDSTGVRRAGNARLLI